MDLQAWMDRGRAMDCTDLHLTVGLPVVARMLGEHRLLLSPRAEADRSFDPASELLERVPAPRIS